MTAGFLEERAWTAEEFAREVLDGRPRTAVFDCDGTLWAPDSGYGFMRWTLAHGLVSRSASDWMEDRYRSYVTGSVNELTICGEMVQVYAGLRDHELRAAAAKFFAQEIAPTIFKEMETLVQELRATGTEIWAVSSTNHWVVEAGVVERFGIPAERVLAAKVKVKDGVATETLLAVPTDEGKAQALQAAGLPKPDAVFGNSVHDLAMLQLARHPFPVNPSAELETAAHNAGWKSFWPALSRRDLKH